MKSSFPKTKFPFLACSDFLFRIDGRQAIAALLFFFSASQSVAVVAILTDDDGGDILQTKSTRTSTES